MLNIKAYASGSTGNLYTLSDGTATIMLDCGLPARKIQQLTGFRLPNALLVTHEHGDHSHAVTGLQRLGVDAYMTQGTAEAIGALGHRTKIVEYNHSYRLTDRITASVFKTQHDVREPCGFIVQDSDDKVLYATDTYYLKYQFPGLTKIMIEANHSYKILAENVRAGRLHPAQERRLIKSHFSVENVLDFLAINDLSMLKEIWLIHLSAGNADPVEFKRLVAAATGKPVYIARGGG
ncbi:MBL fold metallo-hydrolase [Propionispora hippei]|uniref:Phosphoribosyl 1,2-cyclic phosphodiesterase n=1 Tax=Propionispora hippei DSM 15287 TaxID=1123003 RepID=A0A1M6HQG9_9FIRM|nr:MBL fold metallo-hydrolase [Propionispora hippei]SHJ24455.1 Phosphoribosyl 1,2-cyclic phosphodiesterase [Propionispora hippei DSM 15287]